MPKFISLLKFTEQGAKAIGKSPDRAQAFEQSAAKAGIKVLGQYWTTGRYDGVLIIEAADQRTALRSLAQLAADGNVRTETLLAFGAAELREIVSPA